MLTDNNSPARSPRPARAYAQMPRFQRVKVSVLGRYMLADRREFPCQVLEMSPGDACVIALTWLANKDILNLPEDRRHERVVPDNRHSTVVLDDGRRYNCKIIDISLSGAAIELAVRPAMGTPVTLGRMRARVVRHFQDGVAVEFASAQEMLTVVQQNLRMG